METRDGVDHLSADPLHILRQLHVVALLVHQVLKPFAAQGDPYLELVSFGKEVIHVLLAVEAPVHDEMHRWHAKLAEGVQQVFQRLHVADVPRKLPVGHRKHALLTKEQGEADLQKAVATAHEVVGHGQNLPGGLRKAPVEYLAKTQLLGDSVEGERRPGMVCVHLP